MLLKIALLAALATTTLAKDDQKWVWGDNSRSQTSSRLNFERDPRYEVYEGERPYQPQQPVEYFDRPHNRPELSPINRPGGVYGGGYDGATNGIYGQGHPHYPAEIHSHEPDILTGPVPSWVKEGPFKNYDKCKCTEKFNCNSPGISYGHCDVGKQYCCYATKRHEQLGGPLPSRPHHSIENGILAGPGGPVDVPRPGGFRPGRPGFGLGGLGGLGGPGGGQYGPIGNRPIHSPEHGILVGPGGPFDRPVGRPGYGSYGLGRSAKN